MLQIIDRGYIYLLSDIISVQITSSVATPIAGQNYTLTCSVTGVENFNPTIAYQWTKNNGTQMQVGTNSNTILFSPLKLSDAGQYMCRVTVNSDGMYGAFEYIHIESEK